MTSNYKNSMYPRSFLCEEAKIKQRTPLNEELSEIDEEAIWESQFTSFFSLTLIFALFPWTNTMKLSKQSLVRLRRFHGYHCPDGNTHIKSGDSFKKYSKFTPTIHLNPNSYSFRIMFIIIIVRFFIICFING